MLMDEPQHLRWEVRDRVATVWLSRPPVNAVNQAMYREIRDLFSDIDALSSDIRAMVLAGDGNHFCAGNDLQEFRSLSPGNAPGRMLEVRQAFFAIQDCPVPVIGAVHGTAVGTGLAIAASCDFVIAAEGAQLGVPEIKVGLMGAARHLSRLVPQPFMRRMYFSGDPVAVEELVALGAIIEVVPSEELLAEAQRHAGTIAQHSPLSIRYAKRSLNQIESMDLKTGYEFEQSLSCELSGFDDPKEAVQALLERRAPRFTGS